MKMLEDRIRADGIVREGNVLKVDSFINHQMDVPLFREMAREWKRLFAGKPINKVLTIEASGIGIAAIVASEFNVPVVFAKKSMSINLDYNNYETKIQSFTHKKIYNVIVSKKFLTPEDHVLIIDFKSNRMVPDRPGAIPDGLVRQMRAYTDAMRQIYPNRRIDCAILWTRTGALMAVQV